MLLGPKRRHKGNLCMGEIKLVSLPVFECKFTVHAQQKLLQERQFKRAPMSAQAIPLYYLELHVRSSLLFGIARAFQDFCIRNSKMQ